MSEEKQKLTIVKDGKEEVKEINKPTAEEVAQYKEEFDKAVKDFQEARWDISEKGTFESNDVGMFLTGFMKNFAFWSKTGWMGMLKMDEELKKAIENISEDTCLSLDYQGLEFCAYMLSNPACTGLASAYEFEKIADKYSKFGVLIGKRVEEARATLKETQFLQEKWAAGEQGFYIADLEPKPEETKEGDTGVPKTEKKIVEMNVSK